MVFSNTTNERNGVYLRRISSIEPRSPATPNGNDQHQIYTVPDFDDNVFTDEREGPISEVPPTPGTEASRNYKADGSKRKLQNLVLVALCVIVTLILVAFAAVFFLKTKDSSSSPLSSSSAPSTSTVKLATTLSSSQASTTEPPTTSSPPEEIHYDGHLNLSLPWDTSVVELETLFIHDMNVIIATSPLYKSYVKSSLLNVSAREILIFTLDFEKTSLLEAFNATEEVKDNSLARTVQTILRNQVVTNAGIKLPIIADSIVIIAENIPVTATTSASTQSVTFTTETETKGQCISMTLEPCHSLLGSSTFYLPNILLHKTVLQAEDAYKELSGPAVNTSCSDVSLFYLCSLLFPSCGDMSDVPLYPCDTLCEVVKNECGTLNGWPQNCTDLPKVNCRVSDIKSPTTTQTTLTTTDTTSTVTLPTVMSTVMSAASTSLKTTTPVPTVTSIQTEFQCVPFNFSQCNALGFNETVLPSFAFKCHDIQCLTERFRQFAEKSMDNECTSDFSFFCAYTFRGCNKDNMLDSIGPCFESCIDAVDHCGKFMPNRPDCFEFNRIDLPCIPSQPAPLTTVPLPNMCIDQTYSYCASEGFLKMQNVILDEIIKDFEIWALPTIESGCSEVAKFFFCGTFFPVCEENNNARLLPCRKYCNDVYDNCPNVTFPMDCSTLEENDQCLRPQFTTTIATSASTVSPTSTVTTSTTTLGPHCEPLKSSICSQFGYSLTSFPNLWGDNSAEDANKTYYRVAERSVAAGCSSNILFYVCSALFPSCEGDGQLKLPCTSYCKEVNENCHQLFNQTCDELSDPSPDHCLSPPTRTACQASEFSCININKCVPLSALCNKENDCGDWSDERKCKCNHEFEIQCAMGLCIPSYYRCDEIAHCPDNSDEVGCECNKNQYKCDNCSQCIMPEWVCDGQFDCPEGDDEKYCHNCEENEFMCVDKTCISFSEECDGIPQCADHSDEMNCIFKAGPKSAFFIKVKGEITMACSDGFTDVHGQTACVKMGETSLKAWTLVEPDNYISFFQLDPNGEQMSVIGKGKSVNKCPSKLVAVECHPKECGHPSENLPSYIINGQDALPGRHPWMVSLQKYNIHHCGGAIVHPYFVITAAHCIDESSDYSHMRIVAGTLRLSEMGSYGLGKEIRRAISYPLFRWLKYHDIALLELTSPLDYNDFIKPLCLPEKDDMFTRASHCFITGWGHKKGIKGQTSDELQETKLSLWDTGKCNSSYMWNGRMQANEMCAGYFNGHVAACSGDSGSPIACQDETKTWKVVGAASYVYKTCSVATKPMVFTPIQPYLDWIKNHTVCQFTCDDGICLFDKGMLCDTVADCKDGSDEINLCDVSANCTFSDKFMCGYHSKWQLVSNGGPDSGNRLPLYDHTVGKFPGMYLLGINRGDDIKTPRIDLTSSHCFRFHYHMRGKIDQGMDVFVYNLDHKQWINAWNVEKNFGPDKWLMGTFDLAPGHFDIVFRPHDNRRFALDDMWLIEGKCDNIRCFDDEFMCETFGTKNCLPLAVKCNIVVDCKNGEDEKDCTDPAYVCDFENGNICGLEQHSDDTIISEWVSVNSSSTPKNLQDHTFGNDSGTMLKIKTESLLKMDQVFMSQELYLHNMAHCLKFFYASTSPVTLQVTLEINNTLQNLIKFTDRKTQGWISTQATLPAFGIDGIARLTYAVIGGELDSLYLEQSILLDDISITSGRCPTFSCQGGSLLCEGEAFCVKESKICDRVVDCNRATDEIRCECTTTEFKCPSGPCIPKTKTCDLIKSCSDGSDEGEVCDYKRSVSCNFEDVFLCGYTVNSSVDTFHWEHGEGKTGDDYTGPSSDHTFINDAKLIGSYIVANSQHKGDNTSLESVSFISSGKGLLFFYHARHLLSSAWMTGRLTLIITFKSNGTQIPLWSTGPDTQDKWKYMCLELPVGNISISFVAQRGSGYHADIALDDIQLLDTSCDLDLIEGRISGGIAPTTSPHSDPGCPETEKACRSKMCLPAHLFCDKVRDCPDGSDEFDC